MLSDFYKKHAQNSYGATSPSFPTGNSNTIANPFTSGGGFFNSPSANNPPQVQSIFGPQTPSSAFGQPPLNPTPAGPPPRNFQTRGFNSSPAAANVSNLGLAPLPLFFGSTNPVDDVYETFSPQASTNTPSYSISAAGISDIADAIKTAKDCDTFGIQSYSEPADSGRIRVNDYVNFQSNTSAPITESKYFDFYLK
jgi:hypothetical protein